MKEQSAEKFTQSPFRKSFETTPNSYQSVSGAQTPASSDGFSTKTGCQGDSGGGQMKTMTRKGSTLAFRIREHVRLGHKLSETVKGKLRLGARIVREGGRKNIFIQIFGFKEGEELLKASQCYLSTTAGPIAGLLFISTQRIAFCSETPLSFSSPDGDLASTPYKVVIPISKIKSANESEHVENPAKKFIEIITTDNFEFWFMGFLRYEKAFKNLQKAIYMANSVCEKM